MKLHGAALKAHLKKIGRRPTRRVRTMKNGRPHRKKSFTLPVAILAGVAPGAIMTVNAFKTYGTTGGAIYAGKIYTGYNIDSNKFNLADMRYGTLPVLVGFLVHKVASAIGINAAIARAGIPVLRI